MCTLKATVDLTDNGFDQLEDYSKDILYEIADENRDKASKYKNVWDTRRNVLL